MYANLAKPHRNRVELERQIDTDDRSADSTSEPERETAAKKS